MKLIEYNHNIMEGTAHTHGPVTMIAKILLIIGGLNWGLVGLWDYNLVEVLLGAWPTVVTIVYALVGLSALWILGKLLFHKTQ